jgi:hypothetical protein
MTEPQQVAKYLGMMVDMVQGCLTVPTEKKEKILQLLREALELRDACPFRLVQKVAGHLMACRWGFGHISRLMTMSLYHDLKRNDFRSPTVRLSAEAVRDLTFWQGAFDTWDGVRKKKKNLAPFRLPYRLCTHRRSWARRSAVAGGLGRLDRDAQAQAQAVPIFGICGGARNSAVSTAT